ncbi:MAG: hypothetical protein EOP54_01810 [Sphingobacteriales bacterium]|nr:MAG: hypothetical protein EOP54_01810 [Sphingobacteriales bacterium]
MSGKEQGMYRFDFDAGRLSLFPGGYSALQVASIELLVAESFRQGLVMKAQLAYLLATAYHECHNPAYPQKRLTPMKEFGSTRYLKSKAYYPYYGRGFVQLTWKSNYEQTGKRLGIDLLQNPDLALNPVYAGNIMVYGMKYGVFTGKKLSDYINPRKIDFLQARRIINGIDKSKLIADYALLFQDCLFPVPF